MPWENVPCHRRVRNILARAFQREALGRTTLVHGPSGAGQEVIARAITQTYTCKNHPNDFCGECASCRKIEGGIHPDVVEMHPWEDWSEENNKEKQSKRKQRKKNQYSVEHMRVMQELAMHMPFEGEVKFYIIHDAHCMNESSSNSLLKILEEPHEHTRFILTTDRASGILPTIRSRCWAIRLLPQDIQVLAESLQSKLEPEKALAIARASGGLPEKADELIESDYLDRRDMVFDILQQIKKRESAVMEISESLAKNKQIDLRDVMSILLRIVRDGIVTVSGDGLDLFENIDRRDDLLKLWSGAQLDRLIEGAKSILDALEDMDRFVNPSIVVMDLLLRLRRSFAGQ